MQKDDYEWFLEHYSDLYKTHGTSYIAIKDRVVLGVYDSYSLCLRETLKTEKEGTFIVQYCNGDESGYTVQIASTHFMG